MTQEDYYLQLENIYISNLKICSIAVALEIGIFETIERDNPVYKVFIDSIQQGKKVFSALVRTQISLGNIVCEDDRLFLTSNAKTFLLKASEFYYGNEILRKADQALKLRILNSLEGSNALKYAGQPITQMWEAGSVDTKAAEHFTLLMHSMMAFPAYSHCNYPGTSIAQEEEIIDLGGGSGAWAKYLLKANPKMDITIFDIPEVVSVSKKLNESSNFKFVEGNFFKSIPKSKSYLLSNILHDWPIEMCTLILKNINDSIEKSGTVYIHECILDESHHSPSYTCLFDLLMAVNHGSQQFTQSELLKLMKNNGFEFQQVVSEVAFYRLLKFKKS